MLNCTPNHYRKAIMFNCCLQSIFLIRWSPHPYTTTSWELGEWGLIRQDHSLSKVQWFLDHLLGLPVSPDYLGWSKKWLVSRCSTFVPKSSKVSSDWWHTQLHLLWQISGWNSRFPLHWSLKASDVSCWWPRTTRIGFYSLLGLVLELGDDRVHSGQWNGQIPGYLLLTCTSLFLTNSSAPLKICEFQRTPLPRHVDSLCGALFRNT